MVAVASPPPLRGQERRPESADSVRIQLARLASLVDSLKAEVARLQQEGKKREAQDAMARLRAAAKAAASAAPKAAAPETQEFVGRQRSLQKLNPEISMNADMLAFMNPDNADADNFIPREFELAIVSNLDPFSRAKVFLSKHAPGGEIDPFPSDTPADEGDAIEVEEGYVQWVNLPGGFNLTLGRFLQRFGTLNRWHSHALPFQTRSLPHLAFVGEESLAQTGASLYWLTPLNVAGGTYETWVEVTRSSNEKLFGVSTRPSVLGHLNAFWQLSPSVDIDIGMSWVNGTYEDEQNLFDRNLYGAEFAFTWRPPSRARYRSLTVRGGTMVLDGLLAPGLPGAGPGGHLDDQAHGFWSMAELRLSPRVYIGGRYDWTENPADPDQSRWLLSPTLTWWQSEFVRLRGEYDLLGGMNDTTGFLVIQVTFAMGPHKHETY